MAQARRRLAVRERSVNPSRARHCRRQQNVAVPQSMRPTDRVVARPGRPLARSRFGVEQIGGVSRGFGQRLWSVGDPGVRRIFSGSSNRPAPSPARPAAAPFASVAAGVNRIERLFAQAFFHAGGVRARDKRPDAAAASGANLEKG
jgi:hypothetical protein